MAFLNSTKPLEKLIPSPSPNFYDSFIQRVPEHIIKETPLYAITIDPKIKKITGVYRVEFVLFSSSTSHYLFIGDLRKELTSSTPFITAKENDGKGLKIEDWNFEKDNIGLYVTANNKDRIYFSTSYCDIINLKKVLVEEKNKTILKTETVYV